MTTEVVDNTAASRFEILEDGEFVGFADYRRSGRQIVFPHTEVFREGHGLGSRLVQEALDRCRAEGLSVVPHCSFVRAFVDRHPEYADLLA